MERNIIRTILALMAFGSFYVMAFQEPTQTTIFTGSTIPVGRMMMPLGQVDFAAYTAGGGGSALTFTAKSDGNGGVPTNTIGIAPSTSFSVIPTTPANASCFDNGGSNNGVLRYTCNTPKWFHIAYSVSFDNTGTVVDFILTPAINGVPVSGCKAYVSSSSGAMGSTSLHCILLVNQNESLSMRIGYLTGNNPPTGVEAHSLNIQALGM